MKILAIHGAFSSPNVFNYIRLSMPEYLVDTFQYQKTFKGVDKVIKDCSQQIDSYDEDIVIMGHSLGGVIGANLLSKPNVKGLITIASPITGIRMNFYASNFIFKKTFVQEIHPMSKPIINCKKQLDKQNKIIHHLITTNGISPFIVQENDGVITLESQIHGHNNIVKIPANHHEVLQHPDTIVKLQKIIPEFLQN